MNPTKNVTKNVLKAPKSSPKSSYSFNLRSRSKSSSLPSASPLKLPLKNSPKTSSSPSISTDKCSICKSSETLRSINLKDAVSEFNSKLEDYKSISKSLQDSTSSLDHAINAIKHFCIKLEPDTLNNFVTNVTIDMQTLKCQVTDLSRNVTSLSDNLSDLSNYVSKLDSLEEFITKKFESMESEAKKSNDMLERVSNLEELCRALNTKLDSSIISTPITSPQDNPTSHTLTNIEELCKSLNHKLESQSHVNIINPTSLPSNTPNNPTSSNTLINQSMQNTNTSHNSCHEPRDCLVIGDSNTKYIHIDTNQIRTQRIATYRIADIQPSQCTGYSRIWVHVGINDLKSWNCKGPHDVHMHVDNLIAKVNQIRSHCPTSKIVVSPILPTAVKILNERACMFNRLLCSARRSFDIMAFNSFCGQDGQLMDMYRCYSNRRDKIHIGRLGIIHLTSILVNAISKIDRRSFATVLRSGQT